MKEYEKVKAREWKERMIREMKVEHKYNGCVWGRWTEINFVCLLPSCLKGLGNFRRG